MAQQVDLNADVGEYTGIPPTTERELMRYITSANVACGGHAGDRDSMSYTVRLARRHGVAVGAHPSFPDREGFGRRERHSPPAAVFDLVQDQVRALMEVAAAQGGRLSHVKPHGALYNQGARDAATADAVARAVHALDPTLILYGLARSELVSAGRRVGLRTASEVFADRAYRPDGSLVPRTEPNAVLDDPAAVVAHALDLVRDAALAADTICVHGDTPGSVDLARRIRTALADAGIVVKAVAQ